jgi:hypothetical protein
MRHHKKCLFFIILSFIFGFFVHAYFFPNYIPTILKIPNKNIVQPEKQIPNTNVGLYTYVDYDGIDFSPSRVVINKGFYIAITNQNKEKLMWLQSDNPLLATVRGYGHTERVDTILYQTGIFWVIDKLNPQASLSVIVK